MIIPVMKIFAFARAAMAPGKTALSIFLPLSDIEQNRINSRKKRFVKLPLIV
jgi:hypothetical protein